MTLRNFTTLQYLLVLRSGGQYRPEHVSRLSAQLHILDPEAKIYCLTDMDLPPLCAAKKIPLVHDWTGWWAKIEMFREGIIPAGPTMYLDLDTDILQNPRTMLLCDKGFSMLEDFNYKGLGASGVMFWPDRAPVEVYEAFLVDPEGFIAEYRSMPDKWGDQAFIRNHLPEPNAFFPPGQIVSHKLHCRNGVPDGAKIIAYHGRPKPWEI